MSVAKRSHVKIKVPPLKLLVSVVKRSLLKIKVPLKLFVIVAKINIYIIKVSPFRQKP